MTQKEIEIVAKCIRTSRRHYGDYPEADRALNLFVNNLADQLKADDPQFNVREFRQLASAR